MEEVIEADNVIVLNNGKITMSGTPKKVFSRVESLKRLGLDVPEVTELSNELRKSGVNIKDDIISIDEMVDELCLLKSRI